MVIWGRDKVGQGRLVAGYRVGWGFKEVGLGSMVACQVGRGRLEEEDRVGWQVW